MFKWLKKIFIGKKRYLRTTEYTLYATRDGKEWVISQWRDLEPYAVLRNYGIMSMAAADLMRGKTIKLRSFLHGKWTEYRLEVRKMKSPIE